MAYSRYSRSGGRSRGGYSSRRSAGPRRTYSGTRRRNSSRGAARSSSQTLRIVIENQPVSGSRIPAAFRPVDGPKKAPH